MSRLRFQCSSRENRRLPVLPALWRAGGRCVENDYGGRKFMPHNMGLCGMSWGDGGGGVGYFSFFRRAPR